MKGRKLIVLLIMVCMCFILTACWDQVELDEIFIVVGMAIDKAENNEFEISLQLVKTSSSVSETGTNQSTSGGGESIVISETGETALEAILSLNLDSSRKLTFQHNRILLISTEIAQDGIMDFLDFFLREEQIRLELFIVLIDGKAQDILKIQPQQELTTSKYIFNIINDASKSVSIYKMRLIDYVNNYLSKSRVSILPIFKKEEAEDFEKIKFASTAIIKNDKLIKVYTNPEMLGYFMASTKINNAVLKSESEEGVANFFIESLTNKKSINLKDNFLTINLEINAKLQVGEIIGFEQLEYAQFSKKENIIAQNQVIKQIKDFFEKMQELGLDIYGLATEISKKSPKKWRQIKDDWNEIFKNAKLNIKTNIDVISTGQITETVKMEQAKNEHR